ncbi:MAG: hypothetical protein A2X18_07570 [Bacteroidetes bacterium GWF2_40_14]|nr:MAG: hypothetical protein A2X18_07570 [Bacteroidetes bacterium GWF2_40_14]
MNDNKEIKAEEPVKVSSSWNAKAKKHAIYTQTKDGIKKSMPAMVYLKQVALSLPPMKRGKRRIVHFEELRRKFMSGTTKEESMKAVNDYCAEVIDIWNKAIEAAKEKK